MRLLILVPHLCDDVTLRIISAGLGRAYHRRGHSVTVAGVANAALALAVRERMPWGEIRRLGSSAELNAANFSKELYSVVKSSDFVHIQTIGIWSRYLSAASQVCRRAGRPYGVTFQDYHAADLGVREREGFRQLLAGARWVACLSRFLCGELLGSMPGVKPRLHEIANGCEIGRGRSLLKTPPFVLTLARQERYKGLDVLLLAWRGIAERWPGVRLVVAGPPGRLQPDHYPGLARALGLDATVRFLGETSLSQTRKLLRSCLFYVQPSRRESFGIAMREAMAAGKAVLATRSGGPEEAVVDGRTGLLVPVKNPLALERGLIRLLGNKALRVRLGKAAREEAGGWRWGVIAERYLALIRA